MEREKEKRKKRKIPAFYYLHHSKSFQLDALVIFHKYHFSDFYWEIYANTLIIKKNPFLFKCICTLILFTSNISLILGLVSDT